MAPLTAFILGLLIGWLIEWVIDWIYWRRRWQGLQESSERCQQERAALEAELAALRGGRAEPALADSAPDSALPVEEALPARGVGVVEVVAAPVPDDLEVIVGIGPVIARKLNQAGVYTFAQLGELTPDDLRSMLGEVIKRLADEDSILEQARQLARTGPGGGE